MERASRIEKLPAQRRALIIEHLRASGAATIVELAAAIGSSQSTVRRDLEVLTDNGYLERTHGGALLVPPLQASFEREGQINAHLRQHEKMAIGAEAALRIGNRESVIFEASSTVMEVARAASLRDLALTVVTNSFAIADLASEIPHWRAIMLGGTIRPGGHRAVSGEPGESFLGVVHADLCIIGAYAITGTVLTDATLEVAGVKRRMMAASRRTVLVADSSKFAPPSFSTFADLAAVDELITDDGIGAERLEALRAVTKVTAVTVRKPLRETP